MNATEDRYHRQHILSEIGKEGQKKFEDATVLIAGVGALGCMSAEIMTRAGIGRIILMDRDIVETSNLHRQFLFNEQHAKDSAPKVFAAKSALSEINSSVEFVCYNEEISQKTLQSLESENINLILDGLDNFQTRMLLNDFSVRHNIPFIYTAAIATQAVCYPILPKSQSCLTPWEKLNRASKCLACLFEEIPPIGLSPTCNVGGVLPSLISMIAGLQTTEAFKILLEQWDMVSDQLFLSDIWYNSHQYCNIESEKADTKCSCCGERQFSFLEGNAHNNTSKLCGKNAIELRPVKTFKATNLDAFSQSLPSDSIKAKSKYHLKLEISDRGKAYELVLFPTGRSIIKGTTSEDEARRIYEKYIGG